MPSNNTLANQDSVAMEGQQEGTSGPIQSDQLAELLRLAELMDSSDLASLVQVARRIADDRVVDG
jgi:hypothetical protein